MKTLIISDEFGLRTISRAVSCYEPQISSVVGEEGSEIEEWANERGLAFESFKNFAQVEAALFIWEGFSHKIEDFLKQVSTMDLEYYLVTVYPNLDDVVVVGNDKTMIEKILKAWWPEECLFITVKQKKLG